MNVSEQRFLLIVVELQASSPACTELEIAMMDWLAKLIKLPEVFMSSGSGGGVIQVNLTPVTRGWKSGVTATICR
jgi:Pyridoxal-dependent decarboxylase conserved domain